MEEFVSGINSCTQKSLDVLVQSVTTGHTFFFREPDHFQTVSAGIREMDAGTVRIWCAACSTGEEPYSIVMTLLADGITNFHIIASDVNPDALEGFNRGMYHKSKLVRTPPFFVHNYFRPVKSDFFQIDPSLRAYISIKKINIMNYFRFPALFDYVFCRNVFMYFDDKSCSRALKNIAATLKSKGLLFIGHGEILQVQPEQFQKIDSSRYRRTA